MDGRLSYSAFLNDMGHIQNCSIPNLGKAKIWGNWGDVSNVAWNVGRYVPYPFYLNYKLEMDGRLSYTRFLKDTAHIPYQKCVFSNYGVMWGYDFLELRNRCNIVP